MSTMPTPTFVYNVDPLSQYVQTSIGPAATLYVPYKVPRKPKKKRPVPNYTNYLEDQLNARLGKKIDRILKRLEKKCGTSPSKITTGNYDIYEFKISYSYYAYELDEPKINAQLFDSEYVLEPPYIKRIDSLFTVNLVINRNDQTLKRYSFTMEAGI